MLPSCGITSFSLPLQSSKRAPSVNVSSNQELRPFDASDTTALKVSLAMADPNFSLRWNVKPKGCLTLRLENLPAWSVVVFVPSVEHFFGLHHLHFFKHWFLNFSPVCFYLRRQWQFLRCDYWERNKKLAFFWFGFFIR